MKMVNMMAFLRVALASASTCDSSMMQLTSALVDVTSGSGTIPLSGGCSFEPVRCKHWCQQPAWNAQDGAGPLTCCSGSDAGLRRTTNSSYRLLIAYLYTDEEDIFRQQIRTWASLPADILNQFRFLLAVETDIHTVRYIDNDGRWAVRTKDGSENATPPWEILKEELSSIRGARPDIHLIGLKENLEWNVGGKRNLLLKVANDWQPDGWVLLSDIDMEMSRSFLGDMLKITETSVDNALNMFKRRKADGKSSDTWHPGTLLMKSRLYWNMGGCDEDIVGTYGYTDPQVDLKRKLMHIPIVHHDMTLVQIGGGFGSHVQPEGGLVHGHSRNRTRNRGIYIGKKSGKIPWANEFLRFNWSLISC